MMTPLYRRAAMGAFLCAGMAASAGFAQSPPPSLDQETAQKLAAFVTSPGYFQFLQERLPQVEPAPLRATCDDIKPIQRKRFALLTPPVFVGDAKQPSGGAWIDQLSVSRCGTETMRTIVVAVKETTLQVGGLLPGNTIASMTLQRDAVPAAEEQAKRKGSCGEKMQVVDTRVDGEAKSGEPWTETWTLQGCGSVAVDVVMSFTPDDKGGATLTVTTP